ncbi:hypothetical protein [Brevibacterium samyangense]|uniref:ATP-binding protein n=1 Tax=Brevibacterium samyangense TaxID=366888 RepID=A0ABN2TNM9_9MICO
MTEIDTGAPANTESKSTAAALVDMALERYQFGVTDTGDPYALPLPGGHVVRMLRGGRSSLRAELAKAYRAQHGKIASQSALADAMLALEGEAQEAPPRPVHLRVAEHAGDVWIDLGTVNEEAVRISPHGWEIVDRNVPVLFRRTALTGELPTPKRGGNLNELWSILNVAENDRPLVLAWLVSALGDPTIPHPVLALLGEQGTGKSSASRTVVNLVDPSPVPLRKAPKDAEGWVTAAASSWVVGLDNLSDVKDWLSDSLCRAATGDGDVRRQLYTDGGVAVFSFRRAIVLNGIDMGAMRGDLAERTILVDLDVIAEDERRTERELSGAWAEAWPGILGSLLDEVSAVLRERPSTHLSSSPRMADFALIVATLDRIHGTKALERYAEQARSMAADALAGDPFLTSLAEYGQAWHGQSASELHKEIAAPDDHGRVRVGMPRTPTGVTTLLKRTAPSLRSQGWSIEHEKDRRGTIRWTITPPRSDREGRNQAPATPATHAVNAGDAGVAGGNSSPSQADAGTAGVAGDVSLPSQDDPFDRARSFDLYDVHPTHDDIVATSPFSGGAA